MAEREVDELIETKRQAPTVPNHLVRPTSTR